MPWKDPAKRTAYNKEYNARPDQVAKRAQHQKNTPREILQGYQAACRTRDPKHWLFVKAKGTAKQRGLDWTIVENEIKWPEFCPVLGMKLDYSGAGKRQENMPSFDRWDTTKGYIVGNVYVISWRANRIKWDCTAKELLAVAAYAVSKPSS